MLILISDCLFFLYTFCLLFEMVNFTIMTHLNRCQGASRAGCPIRDRELGARGDPWEPSALTGGHRPSGADHCGHSHVLYRGLSRAPGRAGDLPGPGSIKQQEPRTGLETWLQPESEICPGERDRDGAEPGPSSCTTGAGTEGPG